MKIFDNDTETRSAFHPTTPNVSDDGSISAFKSGDTSALRALETIVEPGTVVHGYEVGKMLGRGGIAAVYEAVERETRLGVALKVLDSRFSSSPEIVERFLAEGETLASFDHPNIVKHITHGSDEDFVYIAMERVKGITLDQLIHVIKMEPRHYVHIAREISKGLTLIHAQGIVHGDIKPSNILVTRPGEVKISDFGTAVREYAKVQLSTSTHNKISGTAVYMAPELFNKLLPVDYRADIFSLAVTFYKMFTGKLPAFPWVQTSQLNPTLPLELDGVLQHALNENPDDRFVTVKEFCDELAGVFDDKSLQTPVMGIPSYRRATVGDQVESPENGVKTFPTKNPKPEKSGVDWKIVLLCGLAAIGLAAVLLGLAFFYGRW